MERAGFEQQQQLEEERLCKQLDALYEIHNCGLEDTAQFLARELGVATWFVPERIAHATHR